MHCLIFLPPENLKEDEDVMSNVTTADEGQEVICQLGGGKPRQCRSLVDVCASLPITLERR